MSVLYSTFLLTCILCIISMEAVETSMYSTGMVPFLQESVYVYLVRELQFLGILVLFSKKKISVDIVVERRMGFCESI